MRDEIMVSISCLTFNHEKYVRKTLDGFLMQKTNFKFEVLVHDDASTDNTASIIREYEEKYPDIIKPIYQTENQYSKRVKISWIYQYPRVNGKYIAFCEGDDYWTDEYKLQKQFDIMEANENLSICCHTVQCANENGEITKAQFPNIYIEKVLDERKFVETILNSYQFQTSSYFIKASVFKRHNGIIPDFILKLRVGDVGLLLLSSLCGSLCFIDEKMSVYRRNVPGSWSVRQSFGNKSVEYTTAYIEAIEEFDRYTDGEYSDIIKYAIGKCKFSLLSKQKKYRDMLSLDNRKYFKVLPLKSKIKITLLAVFPFLSRLI